MAGLIVGGGGGGGSTTTAAYSSRPAAGNDGSLFLPSDGLAIDRDNGSTWAPWGPISPLTAPVDGDFAWINQGSATVSAAKGAIYLSTPADAGATNNLRIRKKAAPATPYTITAAILPMMQDVDFHSAGLCFRQSSDGKLAVIALDKTAIGINKYTDHATFSANYVNVTITHRGLTFFRIADNGTNRICSISNDGVNFFQAHSVSRTDFLTADEVGFFIQSGNTTWGLGMTLLSWKQE